ncbi:MAG: hypothetical protein ACLVBI_09400 [Dialister invisus]|uniref:hypothetical protein n=1 Tax=Dialister invisus TaxID=218538 RepID=UPI0039996D4A
MKKWKPQQSPPVLGNTAQFRLAANRPAAAARHLPHLAAVSALGIMRYCLGFCKCKADFVQPAVCCQHRKTGGTATGSRVWSRRCAKGIFES